MKTESKIFLVLLFIAMTPFIFSKGYTGIVFSTETGAIGDTIGGITAPFINLLAAYLVWRSFNEQVQANKLLSKETSYNFIKSLLNDTKGDYNSLIGYDSYNFPTLLEGNYKLNEWDYKTFENYTYKFLHSNEDLTNHTVNIKSLMAEILYNTNISNSIKKSFSSRIDDIYKELLSISDVLKKIRKYMLDNIDEVDLLIKESGRQYNVKDLPQLHLLVYNNISTINQIKYYKERILSLKE